LCQERRLFSLQAQASGPLQRFARGQRQLSVRLPLAQGQLSVEYQGPTGYTGPARLARASRALLDDGQLLEFVYSREELELRYLFRVPKEVRVANFEELADSRPIFTGTPAMASLSAFLKAVHGRRKRLTERLEALAQRIGDPSTRELAAEFARLFPDEAELLECPGLRQLAGLVSEVPAEELGALAWFVDVERGGLTRDELRTAAGQDRAPDLTPVAAFAVTRHLLHPVSEEEWEGAFPGTFEECQEACRRPPLPHVLQQLRQTERSTVPLEILRELAAESHSRKLEIFLERDPELEPTENHQALHQLLAAAGHPVNLATVAAQCAFVDLELGLYQPHDTTFYAVCAVAAAFDVSLRVMAQAENPDLAGEAFASALCRLGRGLCLAQFEDVQLDGRRDYRLSFLPGEEDVRQGFLNDWRFTGTVAVHWPVVDRLSEADLGTFLAAGETVLASLSTAGGTLWQRLPGEVEAGFSFRGEVAATACPAEEAAVLIDLDSRRTPHYRVRTDQPHPERQPSGRGLRFPDPSGLPVRWHELQQSAMLGRPDPLLEEARTLAALEESLTRVLTQPLAYGPVPGRDDLEALELLLESAEQDPELLAEAVRNTQRVGTVTMGRMQHRLTHPLSTVRANAARLLPHSGHPDVVLEYELQRLRFDPDRTVSEAARDSLVWLAARSRLPRLPLVRPREERPASTDPAALREELGRLGLKPKRAQSEAEWLAALTDAMGDREGVQYLVTLDPEVLTALRQEALGSWRRLAAEHGFKLVDWVEGRSRRHLRQLYNRQVAWSMVPCHVVEPGAPLPILDLLAAGGSRSRVVRLEEAGLLDPFRAEVLQNEQRRFSPLMHIFSLPSETDWDDVEALFVLYPRGKHRDLRFLVRELGRMLELPESLDPALLQLLIRVARHSVYDL